MEYFIICLAAISASGLTLFSGFGTGTLLMPVFAIFFPVGIAIALTAVVHLLNNLFKLALIGKYADKGAVLSFGLPAVAASFIGARLLLSLSALKPLAEYHIFGREFQIMPVKIIVASLMIVFALSDILQNPGKILFDKKYLPIGGILSGFFGGLSGNQGALRSAFLVKSGLSSKNFIGTGVVIACMVDLTRITVYGALFSRPAGAENLPLLAAATFSAFSGAFIGSQFMTKVTMQNIRMLVAIMLFCIAALLGAGII
ncbi:MAG: sulfite exporter TauE/SafE family protein [Desulfobacteraceae bacterium]|nr:sulfite exporter TauE/SafE family protein [Desulfobacteraceae bacterium]